MSFIELMDNVVWSEHDIVARTEAMIRSEFSMEEQTILNRKVTAAQLQQYTLSDEEKAAIARFSVLSLQAAAAGKAAREDMALLNEVLALEAAIRTLAEDQFTGPLWEQVEIEDGQVESRTHPAYAAYMATREAARSVVEQASGAANILLTARRDMRLATGIDPSPEVAPPPVEDDNAVEPFPVETNPDLLIPVPLAVYTPPPLPVEEEVFPDPLLDSLA